MCNLCFESYIKKIAEYEKELERLKQLAKTLKQRAENAKNNCASGKPTSLTPYFNVPKELTLDYFCDEWGFYD